jgi:glycosyltransferase involved in cell wall biosynthesis
VDKVFSRCDVIVALTHKIKDFYDEVGCKNVVVINNIIERPLLSSERYNDGLIHLLFLGGITEEKGVFDMLDVINENKSAFDGRLMFHIGGNKEVDRLKSIIASNKLQNVVKFEGWLSGNEKVKMLNMCDIFILPSHTEGLPISILEALSYGKYIISTNVGGIPEIVTKDNGILFAPKDKKALSRILNGIATSGLEGMSPDVIRTTAANYMPENVAMQLDKLYKQIL